MTEMLIRPHLCQGIVHKTGRVCKCKATMMVAAEGPFLCGRHFKTFMNPVASVPRRRKPSTAKPTKPKACPVTCSICLDDIKMLQPVTQSNVKTLECGHQFHEGCINTWLAGHTTCPVCRQAIAPPPHANFFYRRLFAP